MEINVDKSIVSKNIKHYGEGMADVIVCLEILKQIFAVTNVEIEEWVKFKQGRNLKKIGD